MRYPRALGTLGLLLLAFTATSTAMGAELLETLPEKTRSGTGESIGSLTYETLSGLKIICTSGTGIGEETSNKPPRGTYHATATGCNTSLGVNVKCTGLGDKNSGEVLLLGTWEGVFDKNPLKEALVTAVVSSPEPVHLVCGGFVLVVVEGARLCLATNATEKSKTHNFVCKQSKGDPEEIHYWNTTGEEKTVELKQKIGTEPAEKAAEGAEGKVVTTEEVFGDV